MESAKPGDKRKAGEQPGDEERAAKKPRYSHEKPPLDAAAVMDWAVADLGIKSEQAQILKEKDIDLEELQAWTKDLDKAEKKMVQIYNLTGKSARKIVEGLSYLFPTSFFQGPIAAVDPVATLERVIALLPGHRSKQREYPFSFLGRDTEFRQVFDVVASNFAHRNAEQKTSHKFLLVPGGPGIGKTRFAHELQKRLRNFTSAANDPALVASLQNPLYLLIDFNNGMQYDELFDLKMPASVRLGLRLLKAYFGGDKSLTAIWSLCSYSPLALESSLVLRRIIAEERKHRGPHAPICFIIHIDEFQLYIDDIQREEKQTIENARKHYKNLLKQIGMFMMHDSTDSWDPNVFILPVCSGISEIDTTFLPNEYGNYVVHLPPLTRDEAMEMANETYSADPAWAETQTQNYFQVALSDTGYIPRYIEYLLEPAHCNITDWGDLLYRKVSKVYGARIVVRSSELEQAALLALTAETVTGDLIVTKDETLSEFERTSLVFLSKSADHVEEGYYIVQMPFVQLKLINTALANKQLRSLFPSDLLFFPSIHRPWKWDDFALMLPHFHTAICRAYSELFGTRFNGRFKLRQLLRGCRGSPTILNLEVRLEKFGVFHEDTQFLPTLDTVADVVKSINCDGEAVDLFSGTFVCRAGNSLIDYRTYFHSATKNRKPVALFFHFKPSGVNAVGNKMTLESLKAWHERCTYSFAEVAKQYTVGFVLVTNRDVALPGVAD